MPLRAIWRGTSSGTAPWSSDPTRAWRHRNLLEASAPPVEEEAEPGERLAAVMLALETLSPRQREILLLRWRHQLTYEQISAKLGIAPGTASTHMQRAIAHLKRMLPRFLCE